MNKAELIAARAAYPDGAEIAFANGMGDFDAVIRPVTVRQLVDRCKPPPYRDEPGSSILRFLDRLNLKRGTEAGPPVLVLAISEAS